MAKKIKTLDDMKPNVFEAIKRAYIKKGVVPHPRRPKPTGSPPGQTAKKPEAKADQAEEEAQSSGPESEQEKASSKNPKNEQSLHEVAANVDDVLFEASTVFPFTLVPDTLTLDREKLTVANR